MSLQKLLGVLLLLLLNPVSLKLLAKASPKGRDASINRNLVGETSDIITHSILQEQAESNSNFVFSPFGFSTILSILSEGSRGATRNEIIKALSFQNDASEITRKSYRKILIRMQGDNPKIAPQFKTWFYIYQNNTAEEDFKKLLVDFYQVEIKDIERFDYDFDTPKTSEAYDDKIQLDDDLKDAKPIELTTSEVTSFDLKPIETADNDYEQLNKDEKKKITKFDKDVDDKQYVETPDIKEEILLQNAKKQKDKIRMKVQLQQEKLKLNDGPEKFSLPLKKFDDLIQPDSAGRAGFEKQFILGRNLHMNDDVASALSGNSIVGEKDEQAKTNNVDQPSTFDQTESERMESKMLLFNGLFFRGHWANPFQHQAENDDKYFHTSVNTKVKTKFMNAKGIFKSAENSMSNIVEIPYENERYALLVIIPKIINGLTSVIQNMSSKAFNEISTQLESDPIELLMPKFHVDTTSRAEKAMKKIGINKLFTADADLSGLSNQKLHIDELVQHVSVRVDEGSSSENALSASNIISARSNLKIEKQISVDRPFLFFVRDVIDNIVIIAGKIHDLSSMDEEIPISFNSQT